MRESRHRCALPSSAVTVPKLGTRFDTTRTVARREAPELLCDGTENRIGLACTTIDRLDHHWLRRKQRQLKGCTPPIISISLPTKRILTGLQRRLPYLSQTRLHLHALCS